MTQKCKREDALDCAQYHAGMHRRLLPLALLALIITGALGLSACGGNDGTTFDDAGAPFTFQYPKDLQKVFANTGREIQGLPPKYKVALGTDETNVAVVAYYQLPKDVSKIKKNALAVAVEGLEHRDVSLSLVVVAGEADGVDQPDVQLAGDDRRRHQPAAADGHDASPRPEVDQPPGQRPRGPVQLLPRDGKAAAVGRGVEFSGQRYASAEEGIGTKVATVTPR